MIDFFPSRQIAIEIFGFGIHWYGLMYMCGFLGGYYLLSRLQKFRGISLSNDDWSIVLSWAVVGVIVGGRLGYVLFYGLQYYVTHPLEIFAVWQGGMSSHGGFIGVTVSMFYVSRKFRIPFLVLADILVVPIALGLAYGRIGNFINQELYGTVTSMPWGISIPGVDGIRHPTQLYAVAKDVCIAAVCFLHLSKVQNTKGQTLSIFFMFYAVLRFTVEYFRVQEHSGINLGSVDFTRGQLLTIPILLVGLILFYRSTKSS